MNAISFQDILRQLKADLIGKDSYRGVTLTYSWLANQLGHFTLGFIPCILLDLFLRKKANMEDHAIWSAIIINVMWLLFEIYNFLGPLILKKQSRSKVLYVPKSRNCFNPPWLNIAFDTVTDLLFFWMGACAASFILDHNTSMLVSFLMFYALSIYPSYYWFLTKMYIQRARYPSQFRLSQWEGIINDRDKKTVYNFLNSKETGRHLFLFGTKNCGKTSLSLGIATEMSIRRTTCMYTTAIKLFSMFYDNDDHFKDHKVDYWSWRNSSLLIIDDINPGSPIEDFISAEKFLHLLDSSSNSNNRESIRNKNVIWFLGHDTSEKITLKNWQMMLESIDVSKDKIFSVHLGS
jgi:hypothetical protein